MTPFNRIHLSVGLLFAAGLAAVQPAVAAEPAEQPRVDVVVSRALQAAQAVQATPSFEMAYAMSTGERMTVVSRGEALRVRYGTRPPATLRHDGQGRFVSPDGQLAVRFALDEFGEPDRVSLNMPAQWQ